MWWQRQRLNHSSCKPRKAMDSQPSSEALPGYLEYIVIFFNPLGAFAQAIPSNWCVFSITPIFQLILQSPLGWPTIQVGIWMRSFLGHGTFSLKTRKIPGNLGWVGHPSWMTFFPRQLLRNQGQQPNIVPRKALAYSTPAGPSALSTSSASHWELLLISHIFRPELIAINILLIFKQKVAFN